MEAFSFFLAAIGAVLFLAAIPYLFWTVRPGLSVARRTLLIFGLYSLMTLAGLLLLQLWVDWRTILIFSLCLIPTIPVFTLGEWIRHHMDLAGVSKFEKLAEQAQLEGKLKLAHMYEETIRRIRNYHGESSE